MFSGGSPFIGGTAAGARRGRRPHEMYAFDAAGSISRPAGALESNAELFNAEIGGSRVCGKDRAAGALTGESNAGRTEGLRLSSCGCGNRRVSIAPWQAAASVALRHPHRMELAAVDRALPEFESEGGRTGRIGRRRLWETRARCRGSARIHLNPVCSIAWPLCARASTRVAGVSVISPPFEYLRRRQPVALKLEFEVSNFRTVLLIGAGRSLSWSFSPVVNPSPFTKMMR